MDPNDPNSSADRTIADDEPTLNELELPDGGATLPGMPSILGPGATLQGIPSLARDADPPGLAGPTQPDGHPLAQSSESWEVTAPDLRPSVPSPEEPNVQVSESLVMHTLDAEKMRALAPPESAGVSPAPSPPRRPPPDPTELLLPALKRKKALAEAQRERSDLPLVLGLIFVGLLILGVAAALVLGLQQVTAEPEADPATVVE